MLGGSCKVGQPVPVWETDDGHALLWSTVEDNVGFGIPEEEWLRMERDLDPATKEQQLRGAFLEPADAFFTPSDQIDKAFRKTLPADQPPKPGHRYVIFWDPSDTTDPAVAIVLDVTTKPWVGVHFKYFEKPPGETRLLMEMFALHALYNGAELKLAPGTPRPMVLTGFDETSMGGAMLRRALADLSPKRGINLAGPSVKRNLLTNLRSALNRGDLLLPAAWTEVRREVLNYKLPDDKIRQDCVMALAGATELAARGVGDAHRPAQISARVAPRWRY
jgi:hypothetical protein